MKLRAKIAKIVRKAERRLAKNEAKILKMRPFAR